MNALHPRSPSQRQGMLTASVLVCLAVAMALAVAWTKTLVLERRVLQAQQQRVQAEYLALSGLARGAARAQAEPGYTGETWHIDAASLGGRHGASVVIRIDPAANEPNARIVKVEAQFPDNSSTPARRTGETTIVFKKSKEAP